MILGIILEYFLGLNVATVGVVPSGFPLPQFPNFYGLSLTQLLLQSFIIALVSYIGSIALAKSFAYKSGTEINPTQEFVALGSACLLSSFCLGHPIGGSFSRTAVNYDMGASSPLSSVFTSSLILTFLFLLTPVFQYLPKFVLACVVVMSVRNLVDYREIVYLIKVSKSELAIFIITFFSTLIVGIDNGLFISIGVSLFAVIFKTSRPRVSMLGKTMSGVYRNLERFPTAKTHAGIVILRLEADLYFANIGKFKDTVLEIRKKKS